MASWSGREIIERRGMSELPRGFTPRHATEQRRRSELRNRGYRDGMEGRPKASTDPEYLTSYRRGREAAEDGRKGS